MTFGPKGSAEMIKHLKIASLMMVSGIILRFYSYDIAWPRRYSFSGPREATKWAIQEAALSDIGMGIFYLGGILLVGILLINYFKNKE